MPGNRREVAVRILEYGNPVRCKLIDTGTKGQLHPSVQLSRFRFDWFEH